VDGVVKLRDFTRGTVPGWLQKAWTGARRRGLDALTPAEVDAVITAHRLRQDPVIHLLSPPAG
jgi:hypothetical protein